MRVLEKRRRQNSPEEASQELADYCLDLNLRGTLSAEMTCVIAYFAKLAGVQGAMAELAEHPRSTGGHFQRRIDRALGHFKDMKESSYMLTLAARDRTDIERALRTMPVLPPHEALAQELASNASWQTKLQEAIAADTYAENYKQHPAVLAAPPGALVVPIELYVDAVPIVGRDSLIGFHVVNSLTGMRHIAVTLRKSRLCACSCRGWCTLHEVWRFLQWSLECAAAGRAPLCRHDGGEWATSDRGRAERARVEPELSFRAAVIHVKSDWSELVTTLGLPS